MINEHFHSDIHNLSPLSPECLECGELFGSSACVSEKSVLA